MATYTYLDVSTAHVTQEEMEAITVAGRRGSFDPLLRVSAEYRYGAYLAVPDEDDDSESAAARRAEFPNVQAMFERARELDAIIVRLDRDGDTDPKLPVYDW